jgi:dTDP-4-amino-4,6-dideoxygalactose transaminase
MEDELTEVFRRALRAASFVGGSLVENFEKNFAAFCGVTNAIAVSSGTDALRFAIMASGIAPGSVILTVPNTFIATVEAITQAACIAEFVEIDEASYNLSAECLLQHIAEQCRVDGAGRLISLRHDKQVAAILPVHLYGQMAEMDALLSIADKYGLTVFEDACQAHGAKYRSQLTHGWRAAGSVGKAAAFSFYPGKNLGACGEGGAVTTNDAALAKKVRMLRDHGQATKYYHSIEGYNGRLDAIQAGFLDVKLRSLAEWNTRRRHLAAEYNRLLADVPGVICPYEPVNSRAVYHLYVVRVAERKQVIEHLKDAGIATGIHYPVPLHLQEAYKSYGYEEGDFPITERVASEIISLPMFPQMTAEQQKRVVEVLAEAVSRSANEISTPAAEEETLTAMA